MSYPTNVQFGVPDYSGFTTEEELARRYITTSARGSPAIGTMMPPRAITEAPAKEIAPPQTTAGAIAPSSLAESPQSRLTTGNAFMQLCKSRPESALDWFLIFIIIIAIVCLYEHGGDVLCALLRTRGVSGGNFCGTCGGVV